MMGFGQEAGGKVDFRESPGKFGRLGSSAHMEMCDVTGLTGDLKVLLQTLDC